MVTMPVDFGFGRFDLQVMKKATGNSGFADMMVSHRVVSNRFFQQIDTLIDWRSLERVLSKHDHRGTGIAGNLAYPGLVLLKMNLLGVWYGLSDRALEERVKDSISFSRFCGLSLEDPVPDHSIVSRFRTMLTQSGGWDVLLQEVNSQLQGHGLLVKTGILVDASVTESPRKPKGKATFEIQDGTEDSQTDPGGHLEQHSFSGVNLKRTYSASVDLEAGWTKKAGKIHFGYKKHHSTDLNGLVLGVETTAANMHDVTAFKKVVSAADPRENSRVYADKGYFGQKQEDFLRENNLRSGIMDRALKNKPLTSRNITRNKLISRLRYAVERTFGSQKMWFGASVARFVGLARTHAQHVMEAICYNLKRSPLLYAMKTINA
jgi:IS5 family transposase